MSQRFTVSKSDGDRRPSDIQGEVNQLFEGDEPTTSAGAEGDDAAGTEVEVVLKGRETLTPVSCCLLAMGCMLAVPVLDCCLVTPHCLWTGVWLEFWIASQGTVWPVIGIAKHTRLTVSVFLTIFTLLEMHCVTYWKLHAHVGKMSCVLHCFHSVR